MKTVFIAGSITIGRLDPAVRLRIKNAVENTLAIVVGDADGADTAIQTCLQDYDAREVTVFCSGDVPRNNVGGWPVHHVYPTAAPGTRAYFTAKDIEMAQAADYGLMVWDMRSPGTLSNVLEMLAAGKRSIMFLNRVKAFANIANVDDLQHVVDAMSDIARDKAEVKIRLSRRMATLRDTQMTMAL